MHDTRRRQGIVTTNTIPRKMAERTMPRNVDTVSAFGPRADGASHPAGTGHPLRECVAAGRSSVAPRALSDGRKHGACLPVVLHVPPTAVPQAAKTAVDGRPSPLPFSLNNSFQKKNSLNNGWSDAKRGRPARDSEEGIRESLSFSFLG